MLKRISSLVAITALLLGCVAMTTPSFASQPLRQNKYFHSSAATFYSPDGKRSITPIDGKGLNVVWDSVVCTPLSIGLSGLASPAVGVPTGLACGAAGSALTAGLGC